ncbi:hypothetical protein AXF42_Ash006696 [Apostasia shenzhenica]|uniref:Uncharacterized protein n=1 Tax=Apostasia shenzhenica TaxID=1088818 RepID=A0A2I0AIU8_9ASPA|nr:hypothetical protein AXF42_Ash006696 [Apostasia shenzhenica]
MERPPRLRLVFEDPNILRASQRRRGLQRCWYQLRPGVATVAELASQIHQAFRLHRSCPHGLVLTMDDFVLPSFESTKILKDEDTIIIKKKGVKFKATRMICSGPNEEVLESGRNLALDSSTLAANSHTELGDEAHMNLRNVMARQKKSNLNGMLVAEKKKKRFNNLQGSDTLAIKDSKVDLQGDDKDVVLPNGKTEHLATPSSEMGQNVRKRKHLYKHQGSHSTLAIKDSERDSQGDEDGVVHPNDNTTGIASSELVNAKRRRKHSKSQCSGTLAIKNSARDSQGDEDGMVLPNENKVKVKSSTETLNAKRKRKQSNQLQGSKVVAKEKDGGHASAPDAHGDVKLRSRSARRKSNKRLWVRTHGLKKKMSDIQIAESGSPVNVVNKNTEMDEEVVPVIVHPGHIRFESAEMCSVPANGLVKTLQWNGTTSKKKGQKWGREKTSNKWNGDDSYNLTVNDESNDKEPEPVKVCNEELEATKEENIVEKVEMIKESSGIKEIEPEKQTLDFESLLPMTRLPEKGDVLAYRLVELSSSWCPELSPFRIGKVSSYESSSSKIILHVHPKYPLPTREKSEEGDESISIYKEDGSLEIEYASLVDIRIFKSRDLEEAAPNISTSDIIPTPAQVSGSVTCGNNGLEAVSFHPENDLIINEEINKVLSDKKAQLQKENNVMKNFGDSTATRSWSYRSLRRNALGPTLAMLRSKNDDNTG